MRIVDRSISSDIFNPLQEQLVVKVVDNPSIEDIEGIIDLFQAEEWQYKSYFFRSFQVAYVIFVRPVKTEVDWYAKIIDYCPSNVLFNKAA